MNLRESIKSSQGESVAKKYRACLLEKLLTGLIDYQYSCQYIFCQSTNKLIN